MSSSPMNNDPNQLPPSNTVIAVVLSIVILMGFYFVVDKPRIDAERIAEARKQNSIEKTIGANIGKEALTDAYYSRVNILEKEKDLRVSFQTEHLNVSISRKGAQLDDVSFVDYYKTTDKTELVHLFSPENSEAPYVAKFGWIGSESNNPAKVPENDTIWDIIEDVDVVDNPKVRHRTILEWDNSEGLLFTKKIELDHDYMFTITQTVTNNGNKNTALYPYSLLSRHGLPSDYMGFFILHEGLLGFIDEEMEELDYDSIDIGQSKLFEDKTGWIGFTDKYWFTGIFPENINDKNDIRYSRTGTKENEIYQTDIVGKKQDLPVGSSISNTTRLFAGAKILSTLQKYETEYNIPHLELAIDFGMFYFLTKPLFTLLTWLGNVTGHIGIGIILLTIFLKILTFPLSYKAYKSMAMVTKMAPRMAELKEKHKDDRQKMQTAFMDLYQKEGVNPFSGCWPMLLQIPIFFSLYKVILTNIMLRHEPFWGWIDDLSARDPTSLFNLFGLLPFTPPSLLIIGAWPCLMGLSMYLLNRMSPKPTDATQAMIKNYFPYLFTLMLASFASGLVIYWTLSNVLTILQQYFIMKRMGVPISLLRGHLGHLEEKKENEDSEEESNLENASETKVKKVKLEKKQRKPSKLKQKRDLRKKK